MSRIGLLLLGTALVGCGPHLNSQLRIEKAYRASADCSQGPFEVRVPALGTKWGEELELVAVGPAIHGELTVSGPVTSGGASHFGPSIVNNARCRLVPTEVAGPAASGADSEWATPSFAAPAPAPATPAAAAAQVAVSPPLLQEVPVPEHRGWPTRLVSYTFPVEQLDGVPLQAGNDFVITFWSLEPNDLRDVVFVLTQRELVPSVSEAEWVAHLEHERDERIADEQKQRREEQERNMKEAREQEEEARKDRERWADQQRKNEERSRHWNDCARNHPERRECDDVRGEIEATLAESVRIRKQEEHHGWCLSHLDDSSCGEERGAAEARQRAAQAQRHMNECRFNLDRPGCEDIKAVVERDAAAQRRRDDEAREARERKARSEHIADCRSQANAPQCADVRDETKVADPGRPPPAPLAEEESPKPSPHAEWVPGRWVWDGWGFQWTGGGWNVPDVDRMAKATVVAPAPPPEPKLEVAVAQPVTGAVWVPGAWQWNGVAWVWVRGVWRMPPRVGLRWRPPVWVVDARGVRLDPGGWTH